jgi:hypothetical protein
MDRYTDREAQPQEQHLPDQAKLSPALFSNYLKTGAMTEKELSDITKAMDLWKKEQVIIAILRHGKGERRDETAADTLLDAVGISISGVALREGWDEACLPREVRDRLTELVTLTQQVADPALHCYQVEATVRSFFYSQDT